MFAIFLSEKMDVFYSIILSFPTIIFTCLVIFCLLFWLVAILGVIDISVLDLPEIDFGGDSDLDLGMDSASAPSAAAGLVMKFGLNSVPLTVIISLISVFGWIISYYLVYFTYDYIPDGLLQYAAGFGILLIAVYISTILTAQIIKPLRPLFKSMAQDVEKIVIGQTATVRTSRVDNNFGEATLEDGGAGLILKVRTMDDQEFKKGDKVVLIEHLKEQGIFRVVSEQEFKGL